MGYTNRMRVSNMRTTKLCRGRGGKISYWREKGSRVHSKLVYLRIIDTHSIRIG